MHSNGSRQFSHIPREPRSTGWTYIFLGNRGILVVRRTKRVGDFHLFTYTAVYNGKPHGETNSHHEIAGEHVNPGMNRSPLFHGTSRGRTLSLSQCYLYARRWETRFCKPQYRATELSCLCILQRTVKEILNRKWKSRKLDKIKCAIETITLS